MLLRTRSRQLSAVLANAARAYDVSASVARPPARTRLLGGLLGSLDGGVLSDSEKTGALDNPAAFISRQALVRDGRSRARAFS